MVIRIYLELLQIHVLTFQDLNSINVFYTVFQKKRSQYTFRHIFSKRGTILTIFGSKIAR